MAKVWCPNCGHSFNDEAASLIGQRFGLLTVISLSPRNGRRHRRWLCKCDCGSTIERSIRVLHEPGLKSCGCARSKIAQEGWASRVQRKQPVHGHTRGAKNSPTYNSWQAMITRCTNPRSDGWQYYGAKGITVCDRWKSFVNFLADMGERPAGRTLDRKNNDQGYEPDNCRWATPAEQSKNRRPWKKQGSTKQL